MRKPLALQHGDTVMMVAPASPADWEAVSRMKRKLEKIGLSVHVGKSVRETHGYLAGTDDIRLNDIHEAFRNPDIKAIFSVRGGYGSARLLSSLDFSLVKENPKIFWGYSDMTALHTAFVQHAQLVTFHGPMMEECGRHKEDVFPSFQQLFTPSVVTLQATEPNVYPSFSTPVTAPIVGGNLTVLASTIGTPYEIDTKEKILLIEEVGEEPYRLDRMLNQFRLAKKFEHCAGVILTNFLHCEPKRRDASLMISEVIYDHIVPYKIPILSGFPIGHCKPNESIPLGVHVTMDGVQQKISFEPGVQ